MPIEVIQQIARLEAVRTVPQAPAYVWGLINLRDKVIPLIDLHVRFGLERKHITDLAAISKDHAVALEDQNTFALITEVHGNQVAFAVDTVREVRSLENIIPLPPLITAPFIGGIVNLPDRIIIQLIPEQILESNEVKGLNQLV
jgi:purine-binding chemotaxis protein CheW